VIKIDRLRMHLPEKFAHRATTIAYRVGDLLSRQRVSETVSLDALTIKKQLYIKNISDDEIASQIVMQIMEQAKGRSK